MLGCAACGPPDSRPRPSAAAEVARDDPAAAAIWPALLQHCERSPSCDPLSDFGDGSGQASGVAGSTVWSVESADVVKEGGEDYGAAITLSVFGPRGQGGSAARPLTLDEIAPSLRAGRDRMSWLSIEYRMPGGGAPEPYFLAFRSAQLRVEGVDAKAAGDMDKLADLTADHVEGFRWPDGETGARVELRANGATVLTAYSSGMAGYVANRGARRPDADFAPWTIYVSRNIRDEPAGDLLDALAVGAPLSLRISAPDGLMLEDGIYTDGFADALSAASSALVDPSLASPLPERCRDLADKPDSFWSRPDISPALFACDPRTLSQRARQAREAAPPP